MHLRTSPPTRSRLALAIVGLSALAFACNESAEIQVEIVLPSNAPDILEAVAEYRVQAIPVGHDADIVERTVLRGQSLSFDSLRPGNWQIYVHGHNAAAEEVIGGQTQPFRVENGRGGIVQLTLGRTGAFNLYRVASEDESSPLAGLVGHTATAFTDEEGRAQILVAGGRIERYGSPRIQAALVDIGTLTARRLEGGLACPRADHTAIVVQDKNGLTRIALAGGVGACGRTLDVFDIQTQQFEALPIDCGQGPIRGAVAEFAEQGDGTFSQTGRLIVQTDENCLVDLSEPGTTTPSTGTLPGLGDGASVAVSASGRVAAFDAEGVFTSRRACASATCGGTGEQLTASIRLSRSGATSLLALDENRFLVIGFESLEGQQPSWAVVHVDDSSIREVTEGKLLSNMRRHGFAAVAAADGWKETKDTDTLHFLMTGGWQASGAEPSTAVDLFMVDKSSRAPAWFEKLDTSLNSFLPLQSSRAGHVAVPLPGGVVWLVGGDAQGFLEMYLPRAKAPEAHRWAFTSRRPHITSIMVMDSKPENQAFSSAFTTQYIGHLSRLFSQSKQARSIVNAIASADRGVGNENLVSNLKDSTHVGSDYWAGCATVDVSAASTVEGVLAYGEVDEALKQKMVGGSDLGQKWQDVDDESEAQNVGSEILNNIYSATTVRSLPLHAVDSLSPPSEAAGHCPWQQFLRVGFDNLPGPDFVSAFGGVNVLTFIVSNDDCSQGFYSPEASAELSNAEAAALSEAILAEQSCGANALDDYLGFSRDFASVDEFKSQLAQRVNDNKDLIVAFVHVQHAANDSDPPRRLAEAKQAIGDSGYETPWIQFNITAGDSADELKAKLNAPEGFPLLASAIAKRNRLQVCLQVDILKDAVKNPGNTPPDSTFAPGHLWGPSAGDYFATEAIADLCRIVAFTKTDNADSSGASATFRVSNVPKQHWRIGTDTDRLAGCAPGWTIEVDADIPASSAGVSMTEPLRGSLRDAYDDGRTSLWLVCNPLADSAPPLNRH